MRWNNYFSRFPDFVLYGILPIYEALHTVEVQGVVSLFVLPIYHVRIINDGLLIPFYFMLTDAVVNLDFLLLIVK